MEWKEQLIYNIDVMKHHIHLPAVPDSEMVAVSLQDHNAEQSAEQLARHCHSSAALKNFHQATAYTHWNTLMIARPNAYT